MIAIIDYGMGNLRSVQKALEFLGVKSVITDDAHCVVQSDKVILPGVGAFGPAMQRLCDTGMADAIHDVVRTGKPFLGICLGQQLIFERSFEMGEYSGLGIVPGDVIRFPEGLKVRIPHMGWNALEVSDGSPVLRGVKSQDRVYFVHSYYGVPRDDTWNAAMTTHGTTFAASIWKDNVFATQFHPEKSGDVGLTILKNFARL